LLPLGIGRIDYNAIAAEYARHREVHPRVLKDLIERGILARTFRVLEVGCGTGNYIIAVRNATGCPCWGIDPSEEMLRPAMERSGEVEFSLGRAEKLEFPRSNFELVYSVDVIHHVQKRRAYFGQAYRVLRLGGKVCTVTDSAWIIRHREPMAVYFPETVEVDLARVPKLDDLRREMTRAGLEDIVEEMVELPYVLTDAEAYRARAFSAVQLISEESFRRGLERMEEDLQKGPIQGNSRYVLVWGTKKW
jgi:ubiquinone/menaquinone biosynthesis C-methylase UbiE